MMEINSLFCKVDDFYQGFKRLNHRKRLQGGKIKRNRDGVMSPSEIMIIVILFHQSCYRHFKGFYTQHVCKNMKNRLLPILDKLLLRKRFIIETINDQLKNISQIEHSRHRSPLNFLVNLFSGLIAYQLQPKKPSLKFSNQKLALIA